MPSWPGLHLVRFFLATSESGSFIINLYIMNDVGCLQDIKYLYSPFHLLSEQYSWMISLSSTGKSRIMSQSCSLATLKKSHFWKEGQFNKQTKNK